MYNGGIIGKKTSPNVNRGEGIWDLKDVSGYREKGHWPFTASMSISGGQTYFIEGDTITFTVTTNNVPDNTKLFWSIITINGVISTTDFDTKILNGTLNIVNNTASYSTRLKTDKVSDGQRRFSFVTRAESVEGPVVASTPVITIDDLARGGDIVFQRNGYRYHKFTYSQNFVLNRSTAVTATLVAGGGGGGDNGGGGGGGGGVIWPNSYTMAGGTYFIEVGGGGYAAPNGGTNGGDGGRTYIPGYLNAVGGGGGGSRDGGSAGRYGGSGGGGGGGPGGRAGAGNPQPGQGNWGGSGYDNGDHSTGGGGGGAGGGGSGGGDKDAGEGGAGTPLDTNGDGTIEYYAAGGGGGRTVKGTTGKNGTGQGINKGGGGKGGSNGATRFPPQVGDSGICVIKYLIPV